MTRQISAIAAGFGLAMGMGGGAAVADSIDPTNYVNNDLAVGESVTIEKTVTVSAGPPTSALIDSFFLFDTSGSMGGDIANAKLAAGDILSGLESFGDNASGVGVFSEGALLADAIRTDITPSEAAAQAGINAVTVGDPDGGGDFPENGNTALKLMAENASWRAGSNRFAIVLGDASFKSSGVDDQNGAPVATDAETLAALDAANVNVIGLRFRALDFADAQSDDTNFTQSIEDFGGDVFSGGTLPSDIVDAITAGITGSFADYGNVTVGDLGGGLPFIGVSTTCLTADIGACAGPDAVGDYDRSVERAFTFDVTFTRLAAGDAGFLTHALVDGGIVASETDLFGDSSLERIPAPPALALMGLGLAGFGWLRRRRHA